MTAPKLALRSLILFSLVSLLGLCAWPQGQTIPQQITVSGDIPTTVHLKSEDLDKLPQETATVQEDEGSVLYTGVLLRSVLQEAGTPVGKGLRGKAMASYVLAKARDGYEVIFTLPELDSLFGDAKVLVAYKREGKPLSDLQGPFKILCPNDKAGARSLRMLDSLEVVRLRK